MSVRHLGAGRAGTARAGLPFLGTIVAAYAPDVYGRHGELTGTTLIDYSGRDHHGVYANVTLGAASLVPSQTDGAATYNGSSSLGSIPYASWMDAPSAVSGYAVAKTSATGIRAVLDRDDTSTNRVWQFRLNGGALQFIKIGGTGGIVTSTSPASTYADGNVHHFGFSYDGTNIRLYVDGVKIQTTAAAGTLGSAPYGITVGVDAGQAGGANSWFSGVIDDWFVKNAVLSDADFAAIYAVR